MDIYEIVHSSPEFKTLAEYISDPSSPAHGYAEDMDSFLSVLHADGVTTNRQSIESSYKRAFEKKAIGKTARELYLKIGTVLAIPKEKVNKIGLLTQGIEVVSNNVPAFKARMLAELESKEGYRAVNSYKPIAGKIQRGITTEEYPSMTVWIWCRALSSNPSDNEGQIFNITPFVQKCETNIDKNGGNFQLTLPPIVCEINKQGRWVVKEADMQSYSNQRGEKSYVAEGSFYKPSDGESSKRSEFLFHNIISSNDMVWIRFETLELEKEQRIRDGKSLYVDKNQLAGRIYDMIGLVDSNTQTVNPSTNDVSIQIVGRDLSKLFIEDGTYFYALEMAQGQLNFAGGSTQQNSLMQRVFSNNVLQVFGLYYNNSIENVLKFVIQQLSTIKVIPDDLLTSYGDRRNKKIDLEGEVVKTQTTVAHYLSIEEEIKKNITTIREVAQLKESDGQIEKQEVDKIWSALRFFMRDARKQRSRKIRGSSTVGWEPFLHNSEKIQEDMLPIFFHTNLHMTLFPMRNQIPREVELSLFRNIDILMDIEDVGSKNKEIREANIAPGVWQIIKLVIDEGVTKRRIVDSSMSSANGSLLNFVRKICQEPFVEFYMDTYGDTYHLIVRKPPYDQEGVLSMLDGRSISESNEKGEKEPTTPTIINIEPENVLKEQLSYNDQGIATWYHLTPQTNFIGNTSTYSLAYLPAIFFQEYADIWGSKPMQIVHNYMPLIPLNPQTSILDISEKQAFEDLKYMVESNAYLPFTRRGTITVNGDRRLKIGNIVRYKSTGEIFFIDRVQQSFSIGEGEIDRTTTIQVSRGMKEVLVRGVAAIDKTLISSINETYSYFDIIRTDFPSTAMSNVIETVTEKVWVRDEKRIPPSASVTDSLFASVNKYKGYRYEFGGSGSGGTIDCSGFVTRILQAAGVNIARQTSEDIMVRSNDFKSVKLFDIKTLQEGDVIGMDTKRTNDGRKYGIDHIAIVVRNTQTNKLELAESVGKRGVVSRPIEQIIPYYNRISISKYIGNFRGQIKNIVEEITVPIYETREIKINKEAVSREKMFSNFKVFGDCFNFFLRRQMNDDSLITNRLREQTIIPL